MSIELYSPKDRQVFQRETKNTGHIVTEGYVSEEVEKLYIRISGKDMYGNPINMDWLDFDINPDRSFCENIDMYAGGWYKAEFKTDKGDYISVDHIGIGEVIVGAGQSNSTNSGAERIATISGMVSCTDGKIWKKAEDPMLGTHDMVSGALYCDGGSFYPALGDALFEEFHVPVGIASVGYGATAIADWQPEHSPVIWNNEKCCIENVEYGLNLFDYMINRMKQLGRRGFRCVVWHQGETDHFQRTQEHTYYELMANLITGCQREAGWYVPWFVATASYTQENFTVDYNIRSAQERICRDRIAWKGPDTDTLNADMRDGTGVHFNPRGLKKHGEMWAECLIPYIHKMTD